MKRPRVWLWEGVAESGCYHGNRGGHGTESRALLGCSPWKVRSRRIKTEVVLEGVIVSQVLTGSDPGSRDDRNKEG